jgi:hypothetical protein
MFGPRLHAEIERGQRQGGADVRERLGKLPVLDVTPVHMAMIGGQGGVVVEQSFRPPDKAPPAVVSSSGFWVLD